MGLRKYKLGELIEQCDMRNIDGTYTLDDVRGISTEKDFMDTKANMEGVSLFSYKVVGQQEFAYVADTSRRGDKIAIAFNTGPKPVLISSIYTAFRVSENKKLLSDYLFMYFNRSEFDRYARFNSWGSARETFGWDTICDVDMELPDITIQQKYVDIYKAMVANQQSYERGLEDLKLACDGYIENLRRKIPCEKIGKYIYQQSTKNTDKTIHRVMGLSTKKEFREAQCRVNRNELEGYKIVHPLEFAFVPTTDTWKVLAFALNTYEMDIVVSPIYEVFSVNKDKLCPEYLAIWLSRKEFDRYARFHSWGSARENFGWESMCDVQIPIPNIKIQKAIAKLYTVYNTRKKINDQLKAQIKDICPILIKGSLEEGSAKNG
jgi:restriction endonuclease, S subunit